MDLSEKFNILQAAMAACERIFKLLDTPTEIVSPEGAKAGDGSRTGSSSGMCGLRTRS
jgi:ATP-binding cassette subfamily B multidrug efflux pump